MSIELAIKASGSTHNFGNCGHTYYSYYYSIHVFIYYIYYSLILTASFTTIESTTEVNSVFLNPLDSVDITSIISRVHQLTAYSTSFCYMQLHSPSGGGSTLHVCSWEDIRNYILLYKIDWQNSRLVDWWAEQSLLLLVRLMIKIMILPILKVKCVHLVTIKHTILCCSHLSSWCLQLLFKIK